MVTLISCDLHVFHQKDAKRCCNFTNLHCTFRSGRCHSTLIQITDLPQNNECKRHLSHHNIVCKLFRDKHQILRDQEPYWNCNCCPVETESDFICPPTECRKKGTRKKYKSEKKQERREKKQRESLVILAKINYHSTLDLKLTWMQFGLGGILWTFGIPAIYFPGVCYLVASEDFLGSCRTFCMRSEPLIMNSMKLVVPLHPLYWSIHTKDESKCGTAFAFIFGVN